MVSSFVFFLRLRWKQEKSGRRRGPRPRATSLERVFFFLPAFFVSTPSPLPLSSPLSNEERERERDQGACVFCLMFLFCFCLSLSLSSSPKEFSFQKNTRVREIKTPGSRFSSSSFSCLSSLFSPSRASPCRRLCLRLLGLLLRSSRGNGRSHSRVGQRWAKLLLLLLRLPRRRPLLLQLILLLGLLVAAVPKLALKQLRVVAPGLADDKVR